MFWLDFLREVEVLNAAQAKDLLAEADELLRIFSSIKKKLKLKRASAS